MNELCLNRNQGTVAIRDARYKTQKALFCVHNNDSLYAKQCGQVTLSVSIGPDYSKSSSVVISVSRFMLTECNVDVHISVLGFICTTCIWGFIYVFFIVQSSII